MSDIPSLLPYPKIFPIGEVPELKGRLVYIVKGYGLDGISILLFYRDGKFGMKVGDWNGNIIENLDKIKDYPVANICRLMETARIAQAQFYFSTDGKLVDICTHLNRMVGPGMLKDLCGKITATQDIIDIQPLSDEILSGINQYVILKHSSFKVIVRGQDLIPLYATAGVKKDE